LLYFVSPNPKGSKISNQFSFELLVLSPFEALFFSTRRGGPGKEKNKEEKQSRKNQNKNQKTNQIASSQTPSLTPSPIPHHNFNLLPNYLHCL
jgi:hypothetical protein